MLLNDMHICRSCLPHSTTILDIFRLWKIYFVCNDKCVCDAKRESHQKQMIHPLNTKIICIIQLKHTILEAKKDSKREKGETNRWAHNTTTKKKGFRRIEACMGDMCMYDADCLS